jgi:CelD/BcsL family acetyltransferase involved in cellulose biosynthesis
MTVIVHDSLDAVRLLAPAWRELASHDAYATVFHSPDYTEVWWNELCDARSFALVEWSEGKALRGVAAMSVEPDGALRFAGDLDTTDYLGPVCEPHDRDLMASVVIDSAGDLGSWDRLELHGLIADSGWPEAFARAAKAAGMNVEERQQDVCPRVVLGGSYEAYLAALPGKLRHEIRRKARRLAQTAPYAVRLSGPDTLEADLEAFFAMHRTSDGPKGKFMHEGMASFFRAFGRRLHELGALRLALLEIEARPVAGQFSFIDRQTWSVYNSAYDHGRKELGAGMVLVSECIRMAAEEGCDTFDFLRGSEEYKYRFGAVDVPLVQLQAGRE